MHTYNTWYVHSYIYIGKVIIRDFSKVKRGGGGINTLGELWRKIWFSSYGQKCSRPIQFQLSITHESTGIRLFLHFVRILCTFCTVKETNRYMKVILIVFLKKFLFRTNGQSGSKMIRHHSWRSALGIIWNFEQWKGPRGTWKSY